MFFPLHNYNYLKGHDYEVLFKPIKDLRKDKFNMIKRVTHPQKQIKQQKEMENMDVE